MNESTIHGNLTANPVVHRNPSTGVTALTFDVAVNSRRYDRDRGQWIDRPAVFHHVVCFRDLAANCADTLSRGMTVTVTGQFADDSFLPQDSDRKVRRTRFEAADVAVSLRWATAAIARQHRDQAAGDPQQADDGDVSPITAAGADAA